jgi:signal transduction histidine kinase
VIVQPGTQALDQALDSLVHDLRTPLNGIKTWTHVLENQGTPDPLSQRAIAGIMTSVDQQAALIDQLAEIVRALGESSSSKP